MRVNATILTQQFLTECSTSHSLCNVIHKRMTPSQLLSLSDDTIRLCLSEELPQCPKYATLSHCWGSLVLLNLKKSTLQLFRESVPFQAICKTFEHAIHIMRYMGISYLWIDSLCIIQDDTDDLIRESANMSSVYGGSSLNIAASFAPDGTFCCFVNRGPSDIWRILVHPKTGIEERFFECLPPELYHHGLTEMPLLQRGWVVQERILVPRIMHFTFNQVFWECFEKVACAVFPQGFPEQRSDIQKYFRKKYFVESMWPEVVELYSKCKLTYSSDKMVAISGLAQHIAYQNRLRIRRRTMAWRPREPTMLAEKRSRQQRPPVYEGGGKKYPAISQEARTPKTCDLHNSTTRKTTQITSKIEDYA